MLSSSVHYESFVAVIDSGSITAGATLLGLPRPTVSRHLARLESDLGVALLLRTTRRITLTSAGQQLYDRVRPLLQEWAAIEALARDRAELVLGSVRVSVLPLVAVSMAPVLRDLHDRHPALAVEVVGNVRLVDLRTEAYDIAIWAGEPRDPELVSRTLAEGRVGLVASPAYLQSRGSPQAVTELAEHALLRGHSISSRPRVWWPLVDGGRFRVRGSFVMNDAYLLKAAALEGLGITLLSDFNCEREIRSGELVRVLPDQVGTTAALRMLVARRTRLPTRVRVVMNTIGERFGHAPV